MVDLDADKISGYVYVHMYFSVVNEIIPKFYLENIKYAQTPCSMHNGRGFAELQIELLPQHVAQVRQTV